MNSFDPEQFEAELRRLSPGKPPQQVLDRVLAELSPEPSRASEAPVSKGAFWAWSALLRWLIPAGAVAILSLAMFLTKHPAGLRPNSVSPQVASARPVLKADRVEIDRQLLADFDAVAKLPSGEPVRFRCEQWVDKISWRDSAKGLVVEQASPRLEIVPIRFETY